MLLGAWRSRDFLLELGTARRDPPRLAAALPNMHGFTIINIQETCSLVSIYSMGMEQSHDEQQLSKEQKCRWRMVET